MLTGTPTNSVNDDMYKLIKQLESSGKDELAFSLVSIVPDGNT